MINHKNFCRSLAKKGGTITLSSNDQPSIGAFSIVKEGSALGAFWEQAFEGSELWEREREGGGRSHAT